MNQILPSKLSLKIIITILIPVVLMGGAFITLFAYNNISWQQHKEIDYQVQLMELLITGLENSFIQKNYEYIRGRLLEFGNRKEVARIRLLTKDGKILYDSRGESSHMRMTPSAQECLACHQRKGVAVPHSVMEVTLPDKSKLLRHFTPLQNKEDCQNCHEGTEKILGFFLMDFLQLKTDRRKSILLAQLVVGSIVIILVIIIILYITLRRMVDHPIRQIICRMRGISVISGSLSHIEFSSGDEIGKIVDLLNDLAERLRQSREELASLYRVTHEIDSTLDFEKIVLSSTFVGEVMDREIEVIYEDMSVKKIMRFLKGSQHIFFPVINRQNIYRGVITLHEVRNVLVDQNLSTVLYARDFSRSDFPYVSVSSTLKEALDLALQEDTVCLPVVEEKTGMLVGILDHTHIFQILKEELLKRVGL